MLFSPPDIRLCRRTYMYVLPRILLSSSFYFLRRMISELAKRNSTKIGHMLGSKCSLKKHVPNLGYPLPYKFGAQKHLIWTTSQCNGNFNGLYLRNENETQYRQLGNAVTTTKSPYSVSKQCELWSTNGFKLDRHFTHSP